ASSTSGTDPPTAPRSTRSHRRDQAPNPAQRPAPPPGGTPEAPHRASPPHPTPSPPLTPAGPPRRPHALPTTDEPGPPTTAPAAAPPGPPQRASPATATVHKPTHPTSSTARTGASRSAPPDDSSNTVTDDP